MAVDERQAQRTTDPLTRGLGWASIALGVPPLLSPGPFARTVLGVSDAAANRAVTAAVGFRELVAAGGLLTRAGPAWLWARVAGDVMDLGLLANALRGGRRGLRTPAVTAAVAGVTALDLYAALSRSGGGMQQVTGTVTVGRPPEEVYAFWRHLANLPRFMAHVLEVTETGERSSRWRVSAPGGRSVEWAAEIVEDTPQRIAWRTREGDVSSEGLVRFDPAPGGRGTEVRVALRYQAPAGALGRALARYLGEEPRQQLDDDLRRLKQVLETGEVVRSDGAPKGIRGRRQFPPRPAAPGGRGQEDWA